MGKSIPANEGGVKTPEHGPVGNTPQPWLPTASP